MPILVTDFPKTRGGATGLSLAFNYSTGKPSVIGSKTFTGQITRLSAIGTPRGVKGVAGGFIREARDTFYGYQETPRTGDIIINEGINDTEAYGSVAAGSFSNDWFNSDWFNDKWFNSNWFNSTSTITGNVEITETADDLGGTGVVYIIGSIVIDEAGDDLTGYGSHGGDVTGFVDIFELHDDFASLGGVTSSGSMIINEGADNVEAVGPIQIATVKLSWTEIGGMTNVDIYRSTDGVTFTKIGSAPGGRGYYLDEDISTTVDYYYYLVGTTTIATLTDESSTVFVDFLQ